VIGSTCAAFTDALSIEEPPEIRLVGDGDAKPAGRSRSPCECPEGVPEKAPHLVSGWPYGDGIVSRENRPSQRKMAFTTDEDRGVIFQYENLDRAAEYRVRLSLVLACY
jgi:hypothetical protein